MPEPTTILIDGVSFVLTSPYEEGHPLTASEAKALNDLRSDRIKKNFTKRVREVIGEGKPTDEVIEALRSELAAYDANYTLAPGERRKDADPIAALAYDLAEAMVRAALKERKVDVGSIDEEKLNARISQIAGRADVLAEAKRRIEYVKGLGDSPITG